MAGCQPELWTVGRYSEPVVASMTVATRRLIESGGHDGALLIGYSGGGALALLVAERLELVHAVVTLAANLDIDAWTTLHGYSPLATSINPVTVAGTRIGLRHRHLTGAEDGNVPPVVQRRLMEQLPADSFRTVAGFDHRCCWVERWPELLAGVERGLDAVP
jgi:pimeloyl-ACP methyl ester carboxylesterase